MKGRLSKNEHKKKAQTNRKWGTADGTLTVLTEAAAKALSTRSRTNGSSVKADTNK